MLHSAPLAKHGGAGKPFSERWMGGTRCVTAAACTQVAQEAACCCTLGENAPGPAYGPPAACNNTQAIKGQQP
jgi:hypothetical protein